MTPPPSTPIADSAAIVGVVGYGVTGRRLGTLLAAPASCDVAVFDPASAGRPAWGGSRSVAPPTSCVTDVVALCQPHPTPSWPANYLAAGVSVVSMSADIADVQPSSTSTITPGATAPR